MHKSLSQPLSTTWRTIWVWFYLAILSLGLFLPNDNLTTIVKLASILGCLVYVWLVFRKDHLLQLALLLTFIADIFLTIGTTTEVAGAMELGVFVFLLAQTTHFYRLTKVKPLILIGIVTLALLLTILSIVSHFIPSIIILCTFYVSTLTANIVVSARWVRREPDNLVAWFALIGFILFISCDLCTGVSYLGTNGVFSPALVAPANYLAWFFYYPSQIFLSNSSKCVKIKSKQEIVL